MKTLLGTLLVITLFFVATACATTVGEPDPWGGISPNDVYNLADGSKIAVSHDGGRGAEVRVEGGHLWLNGDDLGAYDTSQGVRFLRDGTLTVDGQVRGSINSR